MIKAKFFNENYFYPEEYEKFAESFFNSYELESEVFCPDKKPYLPKANRVCRFCSRKSPDVKFKKDAHIISELLGNHHLISDFECDICNPIFGEYESDLANFLGVTRTIQSVKGKKNKIPKFPSFDKQLNVESKLDSENRQIVSLKRFDRLNKTFQFDKDNNRTIITYVKNPYTPLKVYKAILKMALSVIDSKYLKNYDFAFEYLRTNKHDDLTGFEIVQQYSMPLTFQYVKPVGMIFRKKNENEDLLTHVFVLFALNCIFQISLPFSRTDIQIYKKEEKGEIMPIKWCPPIFGSNQPFSKDFIFEKSNRLHSNEVIKNQTESIIIPALTGSLEKLTFKNEVTGELTEEIFDGNKVVGIEIMRVQSP